jgi:hypothetical protein
MDAARANEGMRINNKYPMKSASSLGFQVQAASTLPALQEVKLHVNYLLNAKIDTSVTKCVDQRLCS